LTVTISGSTEPPVRLTLPARESVATLLSQIGQGRAWGSVATIVLTADGAPLFPALQLRDVVVNEVEAELDPARSFHFAPIGPAPAHFAADRSFQMHDSVGDVRRVLAPGLDRANADISLYHAGWRLGEKRLLGDLAIPAGATIVIECRGDRTDAWNNESLTLSVEFPDGDSHDVTITKGSKVSDLIALVPGEVQFLRLGEFVVNEAALVGLLGVGDGGVLTAARIEEKCRELLTELQKARLQPFERQISAGSGRDRMEKYYGKLDRPDQRLEWLAYQIIAAEPQLHIRRLRKTDPLFVNCPEERLVWQFLRLGADWARLRRWVAVQ
jgi:hypothetical protein